MSWFTDRRASLVINRLGSMVMIPFVILLLYSLHSVTPGGEVLADDDPNAQHLAILQGELDGGHRDVEVMVESGALRLEVILEAASGIRITLFNPADRPQPLDEPNIAVTESEQRRSILIWDPRPGTWRLRIEGKGGYRLRAITQGELFVCCGQILTLNQIFALERSRFVAGTSHQVQIFASGYSIDSIDIKLIDEDGRVIAPVLFRQNDPSNLSSYVLLLEVPEQPFRIIVEGRDLSDRPFRRIIPPLITPLKGHGPGMTDVPEPNLRAIEELRQTTTSGPRQITRTRIIRWSDEPYLSPRGTPIGIRLHFLATFPSDANYTPFPSLYPDRIGQGYTGALNLQIHQASVSPQPVEMSQPNWTHSTRARFRAGIEYQFVIDLVPAYAFVLNDGKGFCLNYRPYNQPNQPGLMERFEREISGRQRTRFRFNVSGSNFEGRTIALTEKSYVPVDWLNGLKRDGAPLCSF